MKRNVSPNGASAVRLGLVCLAGTIQVVGGNAYAQGPAASTDSVKAESASIDEIVVTAQRREERLVDVPVSVSAVGGAAIKNLSINQATQIQNVVPGLVFMDAGTVPKLSLRGIALNDFGFANEAPIATYSNDVYIAAMSSPMAQLFDVNRIEVLRGPQGTLFGRNATGGLIQIITNRPTADYSGSGSLQYGSFNQVIIEAHQNIPLSDSIRTRTAGIYNRDDGWQRNVVNGSRLAKANRWGVRETVDIDLSPSLTNSIIGHYGESNDETSASAFRGTLDPTPGPNFHKRCSDVRILANECVTSDGFRNPNPNPRDVYSSLTHQPSHLQTWGVDNTLKFSTPSFNLTSVTAYESTFVTQTSDAGGTANPIFIAKYRATRRQFSEEVRADGEFDNFKWLAGIYYFHDRLPDGFITVPNVLPFFGTVGFQNQYKQTTKSVAGFGQVDYKILPSVTLTGGIRYSSEKKDLTVTDDFSIPHIAPHFIDTYNPKLHKITWKAGVKWQEDGLMAYASVSTGFKSPAFNTSLVGKGAGAPTKPEETTNYEVGFKGESADRRLQGSVAAFYTDYKDFQQITLLTTGFSQLSNVPNAKIKGVEAELTARPFGGLSVSGNVAVLDTKIHAPTTFVGAILLDGQRLSLAPKFSAKGMIRYDAETNSIGTISPWLSGSYRSKMYAGIPNTLLSTMPGYALFDAGITWAPNAKWKLDFLVQNLTDKAYYTNAPNYFGLDFAKFGEVRTFAVRVSANW